MSELLSPDSTLFRVNQDRQKPKFQDSQTLSPLINKLDVSSTDLRFPLSSGCINQKAIQDIEISYEQSLKSSGLSFLISDSDEWQESVNEQCLPSALSSEEESIDGEDVTLNLKPVSILYYSRNWLTTITSSMTPSKWELMFVLWTYQK